MQIVPGRQGLFVTNCQSCCQERQPTWDTARRLFFQIKALVRRPICNAVATVRRAVEVAGTHGPSHGVPRACCFLTEHTRAIGRVPEGCIFLRPINERPRGPPSIRAEAIAIPRPLESADA